MRTPFGLTLATALISGALALPVAAETLADMKSQGFARVGFSNVTPWAYVGEKNELEGVEPTLVRAFLKAQGVENIDGVLTQYVSLIPALQARRFDIIGAGMQIRPERCKQVAFGNPEWISQQAFATLKGNPKGLASLDDVIAKKARLGVVSGGAEGEYARLNGVPEGQVTVFPDMAAVAAGLRADRIDATMFTAISVRGFIKTQGGGDLEMVSLTRQPNGKDGKPAVGYGALGFRADDTALREAWNAWIDQAKASGEMLTLLAPYGIEASDIAPAEITAEKLCNPA